MSPFTTTVSIILAVAAIIVALATGLAPADTAARAVAKRVGLPLPGQPLRDQIARRAHHTRRRIALGGALGALLTLGALSIAVATGTIPDPEGNLPWIVIGGTVLGVAAGALWGVLRYRPETDPAQPRVAHAQHTTLRDYLDPIERIGARLVVALGVAGMIAVAIVPVPTTVAGIPAGPAQLTVYLLAAAGVLGLLALEWGGSRIVLTRPRPSTTAEALQWDDAQRADDVRTLVSGPLMAGSYATLLSLITLSHAIPTSGTDPVISLLATNGGFFVLTIGLLALVAVAVARKPGEYYLRRLWPAVAAQASALRQAAADAYYAAEAQKQAERRAAREGEATR